MIKTSTKFWLFCAFLIILVGFSISYTLLGFQWPVGSDVGFFINANTSQVPDEDSAVRNAAVSWNQISPSGLRLSYIGSSSVTDYGYNGLNTICWKDEGGSGTLATAWMWYSGNTILETDMVFNDYYSWSTSGSDYDVETVALHELGHWVGLDHSTTGIMRPAYSGIQRSIDDDARNGFTAMYGGEKPSPSIGLDRSSLSFEGDQLKTFRVRNSGGGTLDYQISDDRPWMSVSPESGSSTGEWDEITTEVDTSGLSGGDYSGTISVTSGDADNSPQNLTVYLTVEEEEDNLPSISISSPRDADVVSSEVTVIAEASDDKGIQKVEFYVDNELKETDYASPYEWIWDTTSYPSGSHTIKAMAYDTANQTAEDSISITVDQPPQVSITSPSSETNVSGIVSVKASASDDIGIKKVEFYMDDELKKTDKISPFEWVWDTTSSPSGSHAIKAVAYDTANQTAEDSINVTVDQPPQVSITSPSSETNVSGIVSVEASASDDIGIKKVEFYINGELKKNDTKSPYDYIWDTNSIYNGAYTLKAVAYDSINQTTSDEIGVILIPHAPLNFSGTKHNNSSTLLEQYINALTWQANSLNKDIGKYRIYQVEGENQILLTELDGSTFEYWHLNVAKDEKYTYVLKAVDNGNREGESSYLEIQ